IDPAFALQGGDRAVLQGLEARIRGGALGRLAERGLNGRLRGAYHDDRNQAGRQHAADCGAKAADVDGPPALQDRTFSAGEIVIGQGGLVDAQAAIHEAHPGPGAQIGASMTSIRLKPLIQARLHFGGQGARLRPYEPARRLLLNASLIHAVAVVQDSPAVRRSARTSSSSSIASTLR